VFLRLIEQRNMLGKSFAAVKVRLEHSLDGPRLNPGRILTRLTGQPTPV